MAAPYTLKNPRARRGLLSRFTGRTGNKTVRLTRILDYEVYTNGVTIQKDTGKSPFLEFSDQPERFGVLLGRLINAQQ